MAAHLLNISADTPDFDFDLSNAYLTINAHESVVEILVENVLGFENAITEYDHNEEENKDKKQNLKVDAFCHLLQTHTLWTANHNQHVHALQCADWLNVHLSTDLQPPERWFV